MLAVAVVVEMVVIVDVVVVEAANVVAVGMLAVGMGSGDGRGGKKTSTPTNHVILIPCSTHFTYRTCSSPRPASLREQNPYHRGWHHTR